MSAEFKEPNRRIRVFVALNDRLRQHLRSAHNLIMFSQRHVLGRLSLGQVAGNAATDYSV